MYVTSVFYYEKYKSFLHIMTNVHMLSTTFKPSIPRLYSIDNITSCLCELYLKVNINNKLNKVYFNV